MSDQLSIVAVGDVMLGDHPVRIGNGVRSQIDRNGAGWLFGEVREFMTGADLLFGNLEVVHSDIGLVENDLASMEFRGDPSDLREFADAGFNVLNLANNHCMEHGRDAFADTVERLQTMGIMVAGLNDGTGRSACCTADIQGRRIVVLGFSMRPEAYSKEATLPYALSNESKILEQVRAKRDDADVLVVSLHWGEEFMEYPSRSQVRFAHALIDSGAKIVLGHHPHVLQGVENYGGGVIAYSLGNFVFDMWQHDTRKSAILKLCIDRANNITWNLIPVNIGNDCRPVPVHDSERADWSSWFERLCRLIPVPENVSTFSVSTDKATDKYDDSPYSILAGRRTRLHRYGNYLYFAKNLHRYRRDLVVQSLKRSVFRRLEEFTSLIGVR